MKINAAAPEFGDYIMFNWFWKFLYNLVKTILNCIDFILGFAKMLAGIDTVTVGNENVEIAGYFLNHETIMDSFKMVAIIGFILLVVFTIFAIVRSIGKYGDGKSSVQICLDCAKSLLYMMLVPAIMIIGAEVVSVIMTAIYKATNLQGTTLGSTLFTLITRDAKDGATEAVVENFANGTYSYYDRALVNEFYALDDINYFLAFVGGIAVLILLVRPLLSFVERIVGLVLLFLAAPISISTVPLDEGARFKLWREQVINKFLIAYGALISLNVFMLIMGIVLEIRFFENETWNDLAQLVFIIGGAAACKQGPVIIGNLVNQGAGSQYAQDVQNTRSPFSAMGHFAAGKAMGIARSANAATVGKVKKSISNKASDAIHRSGNARRSVKADAARNKEYQRQKQKFEQGQRKADLRGDANRRSSDWRRNLTNDGAGTERHQTLEQVLRGNSDQSQRSAEQNRQGQNTLRDAMNNTRTKKDGK